MMCARCDQDSQFQVHTTEMECVAALRMALKRVMNHGLNDDEWAVIMRVIDRVKRGRETYGPMMLAKVNARQVHKEATEELLDAVVYFAMASLAAERIILDVFFPVVNHEP